MDEIKWPFGSLIRQARLQTHLTIEQLAEKVGCSTSFIRHIETGIRRPGNKTLFRLCEVLSLSMDAFLYPSATRKSILYQNLTHQLALCDEIILARMIGILHVLQTEPSLPELLAIAQCEVASEENK